MLQTDIPLLRVDLLWAIGICLAVLLLGTFIGLLIGWILTGHDLQQARVEIERLRTIADTRLSNTDVPAILSTLSSELAALRARLSDIERHANEVQDNR